MSKKNFPVSEDEILAQVLEEKKLGLDFVRTKRDLFRQRLTLYNNIAGKQQAPIQL